MKRNMKLPILIIAFSTVIAGCGSGTLPKPNNAQTAGWEGVASYALATHVANQYLYAPECTTPLTTVPCSKAAIRAQIKALDNTAYAAVKQAEAAIRQLPGVPPTEAKKAAADKAIADLNAVTHSKNVTETQK